MSIKGYRPPTEKVMEGTPFETIVAGLTLNDVTLLVEAYWPRIKEVYDFYAADEASDSDVEKFNRTVLECVRIAPDLAAAVICVAAGEPDAVDDAKSLPFPVQVDGIIKVMELTMREVGGLGNFSAALRRAADAAKDAGLTNVPQPRTVQPASPPSALRSAPTFPSKVPDPLTELTR